MRLYELSLQAAELAAQLEEDGGELTPDVERLLDRLGADLATKLDSIGQVLRTFERTAEAKRGEARRLAESAQADEHAVDRLKDYVRACLDAMGQRKAAGTLFTFTVCRNSVPTVHCDVLPESLPQEFQRCKVEPDGEAIRKAFKAGTPLPTGLEVFTGEHVRVR